MAAEPNQVLGAHLECGRRVCGEAGLGTSTLLDLVDGKIDEFTRAPCLRGEGAQRRPLVLCPYAEIKNHADTEAKGSHREPHESALEYVALAIGPGLPEERNHPFVRCQPQRLLSISNSRARVVLPVPGSPIKTYIVGCCGSRASS
jgi:hypothetical protein